jgi:hypothetical protein
MIYPGLMLTSNSEQIINQELVRMGARGYGDGLNSGMGKCGCHASVAGLTSVIAVIGLPPVLSMLDNDMCPCPVLINRPRLR